jgi:hypothetical protein
VATIKTCPSTVSPITECEVPAELRPRWIRRSRVVGEPSVLARDQSFGAVSDSHASGASSCRSTDASHTGWGLAVLKKRIAECSGPSGMTEAMSSSAISMKRFERWKEFGIGQPRSAAA